MGKALFTFIGGLADVAIDVGMAYASGDYVTVSINVGIKLVESLSDVVAFVETKKSSDITKAMYEEDLRDLRGLLGAITEGANEEKKLTEEILSENLANKLKELEQIKKEYTDSFITNEVNHSRLLLSYNSKQEEVLGKIRAMLYETLVCASAGIAFCKASDEYSFDELALAEEQYRVSAIHYKNFIMKEV